MHEAATKAQTTRHAGSGSIWRRCTWLLRRAWPVVALLLAARAVPAQLPPSPLPLSNTEDARTLPKGTVLLRALNAWTRIDEVYDAAADSAQHLHPLGNAFSAESLGVRQFPALAAAQAALRTLTQNPSLSLNLGQAFATADTRIVTTPFSLEYGVTDRLTVGVMVPLVQTHSTVFVELNPTRLGPNTGANVGPNPAQLGSATAISANQQLISTLTSVVGALNSYIAGCNNCSNLAQATALRDQATAFQSAATVLYGTTAQASPFAPLGAAQQAVVAQLANLQSQVNALLGTNFLLSDPAGANAPAALQQFQQLATASGGAGLDSLGSPDRLGVGDVEVSALWKLVDGFADTTPGMRLRATLRGVLRLPTGRPPSGTLVYEVGTGTGQTSADAGAIVDMRLARRFMATFAGQYTAYFTSANVSRLANSDYAIYPLDVPVPGNWREGNALQLEATPRFQVTDFFTLHAAYTLRHQGPSEYTAPNVTAPPLFEATTEQRAGIGFAYSTVAQYARGRSSVPFEVFFTHLGTITASGGLVPRYHRDQIEVRIYYRLRRGGR